MRKKDWEKHFSEWCETTARRPFKWGVFDCGLIAASAVEAMTGENPAKNLIGTYKTAKGSVRMMRKMKVKNFSQFAEKLLGVEPFNAKSIGVLYARKGDIGVAKVGPLETFTVHVGNGWYVAGENGVMFATHDQLDLITVWRIE